MRVYSVVIICVSTMFLVSCGTNKRVTHRTPKKVIVNPQEEKPAVVQLEPVERPTRTTKNNTQAYVVKFAPIAIKKMQEHNIPASITLAQGILESGSGRSALAIKSNNHFGIKCHRGWQGQSVTHDDDEKGECFRKYKYPESSYEDHSRFLTSRKRYAFLFRLKNTNYKGWAYGLRKAGYATDKRYPQKLLTLINKYELYTYDRIANRKRNKSKNTSEVIVRNTSHHRVQKGDTLYSIARKYNLSISQLKRTNSLSGNTISIGQDLIIK